MSKDLSIIENLRKILDRDLEQIESRSFSDYLIKFESGQYSNSYGLDINKNVICLDLKYLKFDSFPLEVTLLKHLQFLNCYRNRIKCLPEELYNLTKLKMLFLGSNNLETLPNGISKLKDLKKLFLDRNQLEAIPEEVLQLSNLVELGFSHNKIKCLPDKIYQLSYLNYLRLEHNEITELPASIVKSNLNIFLGYSTDGIRLGGNPLKSPPIEIINKGKNAVIDYFKSLDGEKKAINEVKVILIGDGGSGKTSLVKQISGERFNKNEPQTHGINIKDWNVTKSGNDITVHFWDFGGQEIMHSTHQFFLSKRSLYILVLDGRKDEKTEYWLKHIESFGGDSPILVVLNKIDQNPAFEVNRKFLKEKYKGINNFYRISCATQTGIKEFTEHLVSHLSSVDILETTWAKNWFNVKSQLEILQQPYISFKEYDDLCKRENIIGESSKETLVEFLHDLGVIMHFSDIQLLDTHVLAPKWVTEAVYKIINSRELADSKGTLRVGLLNEILKKKDENDYYYPPDKYGFIVDLMMKFELCYGIDNHTFLIPDLLEIQEPEYDFDYDNSLKFIFDYDFYPKSVMPRFMVRMHKDIVENLRWRTGVILKDDDCNCVALVKADEREKKVFIYVNGERKREYFSIIRRTFRDINGSFEKLKVTELVPLPDQSEIYIEYVELVGYEQMGKEEYTVGKLRRSYFVSELLNGIEKENDRRQKYQNDGMSSVFHIQAEKVSIGRKETKVSKNIVNIGDGATFHGDFMVGNKIKDSFNKADSSNVSEDLKGLLKTLSKNIASIAESLSEELSEQVANDLQAFTNEATSEKPRKQWWELSAKGMKKAAKTVGEIGLSVIKNLDKIIPILEKIP